MSVHTLHRFDRRTLLTAGAASLLASHLPAPARAASSGLKLTVVTGSPHRHGSSFLLTDEFIRGAKEVGAEVYRFDAAFKRVTACSGCDHCGLGAADCVYRDDMFELNPHLIDADLIVLSTPLYYFGFSAQLKLVIDRFYAINSQLHSPRKAVLLAAAGIRTTGPSRRLRITTRRSFATWAGRTSDKFSGRAAARARRPRTRNSRVLPTSSGRRSAPGPEHGP